MGMKKKMLSATLCAVMVGSLAAPHCSGSR